MRFSALGFVTTLSLVLGACTAYDHLSPASAPTDSLDGAPPEDTVETPSSVDSGATDVPSAAYYALSLSFELVGGSDVASGVVQYPVLSVEMYSDAEEPEVVCRHEVPILGDVLERPLPDITQTPIVAWWQLDLDEGVPDDLCPEWPARTWWVGLGPYNHFLDPMMAERGSLGFDVYGLYLQEDLADRVYIVGMAGTNAMISGETGLTVLEGPLPDGQYQAESLVLMSLADE